MSTEPLEFEAQTTQPREPQLAVEGPVLPIGHRRHIPSGNGALNVIAILAVFTACYYAKLVIVVLLVSILIAFILAPLVDLLERFRIPHTLGSVIVVLLMMGTLFGVGYYSYSKATDFVQDLPKYSEKIKNAVDRLKEKAENLQKQTEKVLPSTAEQKGAVKVQVQQGTSWGDWLARGAGSAGSVTEVVLVLGFIPFLVFFMLSWREHVRASTVMLFDMENRNTAYVTLGAMSRMIRSFIVGNVLIGLFMGTVASIVFWVMGLPYPYFLGFISGFLSLVPYLGVLLALVPPIVAGLGQIHSSDLLAIVLTVLGLHIFALNVLYPKFVGSRVQLNPLVVTLALLLWGWLWGAMGLILAVPITAAMKIIFDHIEATRRYGAWLGE